MPVLQPVNVPLGNPLTSPLLSPVVNPVGMSLPTPTLSVNVMAQPVATGMVTSGWIGLFSVMGVGTRVKQRRMVAMRNVAQGARKDPAPAHEPGAIGQME